MDVVYPEFVVQVGAGCPSGASNIADGLSLADTDSGFEALGKTT